MRPLESLGSLPTFRPLPSSGAVLPASELPGDQFSPGYQAPQTEEKSVPSQAPVSPVAAPISRPSVPVTLAELGPAVPGLLVPEASVQYVVHTRDWHGQPCSFPVQFTPEAVQWLQSNGAGVDLATARVLPAAGEPIELVDEHFRQQAAREEELPVPTWLTRGPQGYGVPAELTEIGLSDGRLCVRCKHLRYRETPREGEVFQGPALDSRGAMVPVLALFTPELTRWAIQNDAIVYAPRGEVIFPRRDTGPGLASSAFTQRYEKDTGQPPPVWVHREVIATEWGPLERPVQVLRDRQALTKGQPPPVEAFDKMPLEAWIQRGQEIAPNVFLHAPDEQSAEHLKGLFQQICGPSVEQHQPQTVGARLERVKGLLERLGNDPEALEGSRLECGAQPEGWDEGTARKRLQTLALRLDRQLQPVHLFVVPAGKHYSSLPFFDAEARRFLAQSPESTGCHIPDTQIGHIVAVNQAELGSQADTRVPRHELIHLFEQRFLAPEVQERLDQLHQEILERGGPLPSGYAANRKEFLTTMGEEYQADFGPDGPLWVKTAHPEVYELFEQARLPQARGSGPLP